ncbi:MAG: DNRLRE domain-containing protein [Methanotrichaceae archaeon]|nr:DNRLRE domain-containing protein [Methanotrichaceae archaeon]
MKYLYAIFGLILTLSGSIAAGGSYKAEMDVDTYVDSNNANQSFSEDKLLWISSADGVPTKEAYLSFVNTFGSIGIFRPENVESAKLKLNAERVDAPGAVKAYLIHGAVLDATWNDRPTYNVTSASSYANVDKVGEYIIDVTPLIKEAVKICTEGCPYSIALVAENNTTLGFASMESSQGKAVLEYTTLD